MIKEMRLNYVNEQKEIVETSNSEFIRYYGNFGKRLIRTRIETS